MRISIRARSGYLDDLEVRSRRYPLGRRQGRYRRRSFHLSSGDKERLCRGWVDVMWKNIGIRNDVPPVVGTTPQMMGEDG